MKIRYSPYKLIGTGSFPSRKGALLEFTFEDQTTGYADCHPWEELGDAPLAQQLSLLKMGRLTPITARSLDFALIDSNARANKVNLFAGLKIPESHYLVSTAEVPEEYAVYKCKDPDICLKLLPRLSSGQKVRMDFNFSLTKAQFIEFIGKTKRYIDRFDFIEDPFPFNAEIWKEFELQYGISLALDRKKEGQEHAIRILKPAIDPPGKYESKQRLVYTSYLDHPLGQIGAAYVAAASGCNEVCGLTSHLVYQPNIFSERLDVVNSKLRIPVEGTGLGFDDCLEEQNWRSL